MSVIADLDVNRASVARAHTVATAYLAASETPLPALLFGDRIAEDARDELEDALAELVAADPRDTVACDAAITRSRNAMRALDVALGLAPGAPPLLVRWWAAVVRWAVTAQEARR